MILMWPQCFATVADDSWAAAAEPSRSSRHPLRYVLLVDTVQELAPGYINGIPNLLSVDVLPYVEFQQYAL
jgi:hypothetical protein